MNKTLNSKHFPAVNTAVQRTLDQLVSQGMEIGVQVAAYFEGQLVADCWSGVADPATGRKVDGETLFHAFSVSKAVAATAVHIQVERGLIDYQAPVSHYWPEFVQNGKGDVTVEQVLTHCSGVIALPSDITIPQLCDWDWMINWIAGSRPLFEPGKGSTYQSMTFGWLTGELVRRTDPKRRSFGDFIQQEIATPLKAEDLWLGIPDAVAPRVAVLDASVVPQVPENSLYRVAMPKQVDLMPDPYARPEVQRACIPAVGGIFTARSLARLFAMLANGGVLEGVRLLSPERVERCRIPRPEFGPDPVFFGMPVAIGLGGYWLGADTAPLFAPASPTALCHPGRGGSISWADPDRKLAVAFCHNRMFDSPTREGDTRTIVGDVIRHALSLD